MVEQPSIQHQSTTSTKRYILIKPDNEYDINDFVTITKTPAGARFRDALTRLSKKYNFSERDYKKGRLAFTVDFATLKEIQDQQEKKNSEGI
jgi:hypothetical protein